MARKADPLIENAYRPHCSWMDGWLIILSTWLALLQAGNPVAPAVFDFCSWAVAFVAFHCGSSRTLGVHFSIAATSFAGRQFLL